MKTLHTAAKRPSKHARQGLGEKSRTRFTRQLNDRARILFGPWRWASIQRNWLEDRREATGRQEGHLWANLKVRPEVVHAAHIFQSRYLKNKGDEVSLSEVISLMVAEGIKAVDRMPDFKGKSS